MAKKDIWIFLSLFATAKCITLDINLDRVHQEVEPEFLSFTIDMMSQSPPDPWWGTCPSLR